MTFRFNISALDIKSFTYNDRELRTPHLVRNMLTALVDVCAIEWLDGHAKTLFERDISPRTLKLVFDLDVNPAHSWTVWLDDCQDGPSAPGLTWPADDDCNRGPVHGAITAHVVHAIERIRREEPYCAKGTIEIRADIASIGMHTRLRLSQARSAFLQGANNADENIA